MLEDFNEDREKLHFGIKQEKHCYLCKHKAMREFDTLKSKKVLQSLEIGLFFCQIFIFII